MAHNLTDKQPPPVRTESPAVWPLVIQDVQDGLKAPQWLREAIMGDMRDRADFGREKYGTPLQVDNGRDAGADAYQEALDLCVYARQKAERTGSEFWHSVSGKAIGLAAAIRYQLALEDDARKGGA